VLDRNVKQYAKFKSGYVISRGLLLKWIFTTSQYFVAQNTQRTKLQRNRAIHG